MVLSLGLARETLALGSGMSALLLKAEVSGALAGVCQGPKAEIGPISDKYSNARQDNPDLGEFARLRLNLD